MEKVPTDEVIGGETAPTGSITHDDNPDVTTTTKFMTSWVRDSVLWVTRDSDSGKLNVTARTILNAMKSGKLVVVVTDGVGLAGELIVTREIIMRVNSNEVTSVTATANAQPYRYSSLDDYPTLRL